MRGRPAVVQKENSNDAMSGGDALVQYQYKKDETTFFMFSNFKNRFTNLTMKRRLIISVTLTPATRNLGTSLSCTKPVCSSQNLDYIILIPCLLPASTLDCMVLIMSCTVNVPTMSRHQDHLACQLSIYGFFFGFGLMATMPVQSPGGVSCKESARGRCSLFGGGSSSG